ncbi:hypothetical protein KPL81_03210 [Halomonas sp. Y3S6]|uniref:Uncharacterized protein n=1 Tax=Billgrantia antri TaxID=2846777 RepID=A0ABS6ZJD4_9GAMM|nr:hypothetical protein [Halomonas antri]
MIEFIDDHRESYGAEPICRALPIAPSTYYEPRPVMPSQIARHSAFSVIAG